MLDLFLVENNKQGPVLNKGTAQANEGPIMAWRSGCTDTNLKQRISNALHTELVV